MSAVSFFRRAEGFRLIDKRGVAAGDDGEGRNTPLDDCAARYRSHRNHQKGLPKCQPPADALAERGDALAERGDALAERGDALAEREDALAERAATVEGAATGVAA